MQLKWREDICPLNSTIFDRFLFNFSEAFPPLLFNNVAIEMHQLKWWIIAHINSNPSNNGNKHPVWSTSACSTQWFVGYLFTAKYFRDIGMRIMGIRCTHPNEPTEHDTCPLMHNFTCGGGSSLLSCHAKWKTMNKVTNNNMQITPQNFILC